MSKKEFTIRTDCEAIVKFYKKKNEKRSHHNRWVKFLTVLLDKAFVPEIEHIRGSDNKIVDILSRLISNKNP